MSSLPIIIKQIYTTPFVNRKMVNADDCLSEGGVPLPIVYGTVKLGGNLVYVGDITSHTAGGDGEWFKAATWYALCMGEIKLRQIKTEHCLFDDNDISMFDAIIVNGGYANSHPSWETYFSRLPSVAHVGISRSASLDIFGKLQGDSLSFPEIEFTAQREIWYSPVEHDDILSVDAALEEDRRYSSNPASIIYDLLTNYWLGNLTNDSLDVQSFTEVGSYFYEHDLGLDLSITNETNLKSVLHHIETLTGCMLTVDNNWKLKLVLMDDDSVVSSPAFTVTDDDAIETIIEQRTWYDTNNSFVGKMTHGRSVFTENETNIRLTGEKRKKVIDMSAIHNYESASKRLFKIMKQESYPTKFLQITVNLSYLEHLPGDVGFIDIDEYGISGAYRIIDRDFGMIDDNKIVLSLRECIEDFIDDKHERAGDSLGGDMTYGSEDYENLTFPGGSYTTNAAASAWSDQSKVRVRWGDGQEQAGDLVSNVQNATDYDYTFHADGDKIILTSKFQEDVEANSLGLLNVDVWEID